MSRLNTVMKLVTGHIYDNQFKSLWITSPDQVVAVNRRNELIYVYTWDSHYMSYRRAIPKEEVVQIVAGFSEIA